jgi:hypothetical protein
MAQRGVKAWASLALVVAAGCTAPPAKPPRLAPPPAPFIAPPPPAPPAQAAPLKPTDACGAIDLQYLIGRPRSEIPIPLQPSRRRVVCSTCPVTQDYVPYRQTIIYDAGSGLVSSVKCG